MGYKVVENKCFVNPYNFIGVDYKNTERKHIENSTGELSGFMICRLIAKTPIAIPDTFLGEKKENDHMEYPFMRDPQGKWMIPGSSLRGVIRSMYETITESCFVTGDPEQRITKRAAMRKYGQPGVLKYEGNQWILYSAERYVIKMRDREYRPFWGNEFSDENKYPRFSREELLQDYGYGRKVYFSCSKKKYANSKNVQIGKVVSALSLEKKPDLKEEGYLYIGQVPALKKEEPQTKKHFEDIFQCKERIRAISDKEIDVLKMLVKMYQNNNDKTWYQGVLDAIENRREVPVWYREDGMKYVFSLASIGRIVFEKDMGELLNTKKPCKNRDALCKACSLFGMAGEKSVGSRIRITNAGCLREADADKNKVTLKELSAPKISYLPFYAVNKSDETKIPSSYDDKNIEIRGRKYYWHSSAKEYSSKIRSERNSTMELVDPCTEFEFKVYFDSIKEEQLKELWWAITLGENDEDSTMCHKIGHGKPIGLGSAKIVVDHIYTRNYSADGGYCIDEYSLQDMDGITIFHKDELQIMMNKETPDIDVKYPYVEGFQEGTDDNKRAAHQWFGFNRDKKQNPDHMRMLPKIENAFNEPLHPIMYIDDTSADSAPNYELNRKYQGKLIGYNDKNTTAYFKVDGKKASVYFKDVIGKRVGYGEINKVFGENNTVMLIYRGKQKDSNGVERDKWQYEI